MFNLNQLKARKKELGLSFDDLARITGYSRRAIIGVFNGETQSPRIDTVQAIEKALGFDKPVENPTPHTHRQGNATFNRL